jgi:hypothetical protein
MPFPTLEANGSFLVREDSSQFEEERVDPAIRKEFEGGFVATRPRYTRAPATKITTGFTNMTQTEYAILQSFWDAKRGGSISFTYIHPTTSASLTVRFAAPLKGKYVGMGNTKLWDVHGIQLETV